MLRRFVNYCLLQAKISGGGSGNSKLSGIAEEPNVEGEAEREAKMAPRDPKKETAGHFFKTFRDMTSCEKYVVFLNYIAKVTNQSPVQDLHKDVKRIPEDFLRAHSNVHVAQMISLHCKYRMKPPAGRYVSLGNLTGLEIPKTESAMLKETRRLKEKKKQETETGVIVHVTSQYCGMRVHVEGQDDVRCFSLISEIFFHHFYKIGLGLMGMDAYVKHLSETNLFHHLTKIQDVMDGLVDLTPSFYSHDQVRSPPHSYFGGASSAAGSQKKILIHLC